MAQKIGRNEPCPCGSGKKYKKCCLDTEPLALAPKGGRSASMVSSTFRRDAPAVPITAYTIAKITEDPSRFDDPELARSVASHIRDAWTRAKVRDMDTTAIERQLSDYGVDHSRDRFLALASRTTSAWSVSEVWLEEDEVTCRGNQNEDFLGFAACELWKRWIADRPSVEMLCDWMQDGYDRVQAKDPTGACDLWWKVWSVLLPRFDRSMTTMHSVEPVFSGMQSVFNWSQDFENELLNAAIDDTCYAEIGVTYCGQWLRQFTGESETTQINIRRTLAELAFRLGDSKRGEAMLNEVIERWPRNAWGYVALADAHSHTFRGASSLPMNLRRAEEVLKAGLAAVGKKHKDRDVLEDRLRELHERGSSAEAET